MHVLLKCFLGETVGKISYELADVYGKLISHTMISFLGSIFQFFLQSKERTCCTSLMVAQSAKLATIRKGGASRKIYPRFESDESINSPILIECSVSPPQMVSLIDLWPSMCEWNYDSTIRKARTHFFSPIYPSLPAICEILGLLGLKAAIIQGA